MKKKVTNQNGSFNFVLKKCDSFNGIFAPFFSKKFLIFRKVSVLTNTKQNCV